MQTHRINTIEELQSEQDRLVGNMRQTRDAFQRSASDATIEGRDFLIKKILIPVGAIGLGIFAAKKIADAINAPKHEQEEEESEYSTNSYNEYANSYNEDGNSFNEGTNSSYNEGVNFYDKKVSNSYNEGTNAYNKGTNSFKESSYHERGKNRSSSRISSTDTWLPKLMLVALPVLQQFFLSEQSDENAEGAAAGTNVQNKNLQTPKGPKAFISALVPMVIPLAQQHFLEKSEEADKRSVVMDEYGTPRKNSAAGIFDSLYKMLPVVLPLIQQYFGAGTVVKEEKPATSSGLLTSKNEPYANAIART